MTRRNSEVEAEFGEARKIIDQLILHGYLSRLHYLITITVKSNNCLKFESVLGTGFGTQRMERRFENKRSECENS